MTVVFNSPGITPNVNLPLMQRDRVANNGTLDIFDARDGEWSWRKQGDPVEGSETWRSLIGENPNTAAFAGSIGWNNGFTHDGVDDIITLPPTFKIPANGKGLVLFWTRVGVQTQTTGHGIIAWCGDNAANAQFIARLSHNANPASAAITILDPLSVGQIVAQAVSTLGASMLAQIGFSAEPEGGGYRIKAFLNGQRVANNLRSALASMPQPGAACRIGGTTTGSSAGYVGTTFRAYADALTHTTPEAVVALDWERYATRFSS